MLKVLSYYVSTPERGIVLKPNSNWNGNPEFKPDHGLIIFRICKGSSYKEEYKHIHHTSMWRSYNAKESNAEIFGTFSD